jgi:AsmA protein
VRSEFTIGRGRVASDALTVDCAGAPIVLSGWTDFDGRVDYRIDPARLAGRLSGQARELMSGLKLDLDSVKSVEVRGTLDRLAVTFDGRPLRRAVEDGEDRARALSRKIRERLIR